MSWGGEGLERTREEREGGSAAQKGEGGQEVAALLGRGEGVAMQEERARSHDA
jgi:hypothetical protein